MRLLPLPRLLPPCPSTQLVSWSWPLALAPLVMVCVINTPKPQPHTSHTSPTTGSTNTRDQRLTIEAGRISVAFLRTDDGTKANLVWVRDKASDIPHLWFRSDNTEQHLAPATLALIEGHTIAIDADAWREAGSHPIIRLEVVGEVIADGKAVPLKCMVPSSSHALITTRPRRAP